MVSTRSLRGARSSWASRLAGAAALLGLLGSGPVHAREDRGPGPLPWRIGHQVGFSADAVAFPDTAGTTVEVYVRIRPSLIADLTRHADPSPIRLQASLRPLFGGGKTVEREQVLVPQVTDTTGALGEVVVLSFPARPGRHRLAIRMDTRRRDLARLGVEKPEKATLEGEIVVPAPQAGREISDVEFVWKETGRKGSPVFGRSGRDLIPNPERLYGLYSTDLRAYFQAHAPEVKPWEWVARVLDSSGTVVAIQDGKAAAARILRSEVAMNVADLPAGGYDLEVKAWQSGDAGALLRRARFSIAWRAETWRKDPLDAEDEIHFLFSPTEEEDFPRLTPGEQERALDLFWKRRDPTPDTAENEARRQYEERVQFANKTYGRYGLGRGMFSDMGRVLIRYGEPSEVVRQVIPSLDDNITRIIMELATTEKRSLGSVNDREVGADTRPFELWIYEGHIPLPIDADPDQPARRSAAQRLVFLFVDEKWLGDFRLLYSSE